MAPADSARREGTRNAEGDDVLLTVRLNATFYRLSQLFHGVTDATSVAPATENTYPIRKSTAKRCRPHDGPFVMSLSDNTKTPCGRKRCRRRRQWHPCFSLRSSKGVRFSTMNTQGLNWQKLLHRPKLQEVLRILRRHSFDCMFLTDMHSEFVTTQVLYVEEFCFVIRGRVAIVLNASLAQLWEKSGRRVHSTDSDRLLAVEFPHFDHNLYLVCNYTPAGCKIGEKREHYTYARALHAKCDSSTAGVQLWGGDWNGHISSSESEAPVIGTYGISQVPTTAGGRVLKEFLRGTNLSHVDSHRPCKCRGTWRHNITHDWYELDSFLISAPHLHQVNSRLFTFPAVADHLGKGGSLHLGSLAARRRRLQRRDKWLHRKFREQQPPPKLNLRPLQGPTMQAQEARATFAQQVETLLETVGIPPSPVSAELDRYEGITNGWEETNPRIWHAYTDGSAMAAQVDKGVMHLAASAGWGVSLYAQSSQYNICGSVSKAHRATNNTGEASALLQLFSWAYDHYKAFDTLVVHYDSEYAMNVSMGRWKVTKNSVLAKQLKGALQALQQRCQVKWRWVKGHSGNIGNEQADALADRGRRGEVMNFPTFNNHPPRHRLIGKQSVFPTPTPCPLPEPSLQWHELAVGMVATAENCFGRTKHNGLWSPYTAADKTTLQWHDNRVQASWNRVRLSQDTTSRAEVSAEFREAKRARSVFRSSCRKRWMTQVVHDLNQALDVHDLGNFYRLLKQIGVSVSEFSKEGLQQFSLDELRSQAMKSSGELKPIDPLLIQRVVPELPEATWLGLPPSDQEISEALLSLRESAAGLDEVTMNLLRYSGARARWQLRLMINTMWTQPPEQWDEISKRGISVALHKSGPKDELDNYRFVVLLPAISRVIAKVIAVRLATWAETSKVLPSTQWGFRRHRSTQDAMFTARLLVEMASEVRKEDNHNWKDLLVLTLIDITKAYTRVQRLAAWQVFKRLGFPNALIQVLQGLHDSTVYQCRGRQGLSSDYQQVTGFREGCCTSPILYNIYHSFPLKDFDMRRTDKLLVRTLPKKPFNLRMHKQLRKDDNPVDILISLLSFADDTTMLSRGEHALALEDLLTQTLQDWGETVKPSKTNRLLVGRCQNAPDHLFTSAVRLLGGWLESMGGYQVDDDKRLLAARAIWRSLCKQLPRYGLSVRMKGQIVKASVLRSLLYGTESRAVSGPTLRKFQTFWHGVARGITGQRIKDMEGSCTMTDVRRRANLESIATYVGVGQLNYLGHIARLPSDRLEQQMLTAWLPTEATLLAKKGLSTRQQLWQRLKEVMELGQVADWQSQWHTVAAMEGGAVWTSLVRRWQKHQHTLEDKMTWQQKHLPAAMEAKKAAAEQRAWNLTGGTPAGNGKYSCPHCFEPKVTMFLRSLKKHVDVCSQLSEGIRRRQAEQRSKPTKRLRITDKQPPAVEAPSGSASSRVVLRPMPKADPAAAPAPARPVRFHKSRRTDDWDPEVVRAAYKKRFPLRQMSLTDLPCPKAPDGWDPLTCMFCSQMFADRSTCTKHTMSCQQMPYDEWLRRVRICHHDFAASPHKCPHCGTSFSTPKARGRHSVTCSVRRRTNGLSLNSHEFHDL